MRSSWQESGDGERDESSPRIDDSSERVFPHSGSIDSIDEQWGRSESLDPDNVGDIADEGIGHRG